MEPGVAHAPGSDRRRWGKTRGVFELLFVAHRLCFIRLLLFSEPAGLFEKLKEQDHEGATSAVSSGLKDFSVYVLYVSRHGSRLTPFLILL